LNIASKATKTKNPNHCLESGDRCSDCDAGILSYKSESGSGSASTRSTRRASTRAASNSPVTRASTRRASRRSSSRSSS